MPPDVTAFLRAIRRAIDEIESFTICMDATSFRENVMARNATHWSLAVIGEAVRRLRDVDLATAERLSEWQRIIQLRNQILHGYDTVKPDITWRIVQTKLPILKREIDALLSERP